MPRTGKLFGMTGRIALIGAGLTLAARIAGAQDTAQFEVASVREIVDGVRVLGTFNSAEPRKRRKKTDRAARPASQEKNKRHAVTVRACVTMDARMLCACRNANP